MMDVFNPKRLVRGILCAVGERTISDYAEKAES